MNVLFLSFVSGKWRKIITPIAAIAVLAAFLFYPKGQADNTEFVMSDQNPYPELTKEHNEKVEVEETTIPITPVVVVVDVKGAVQNPGVYAMQDGDRLIDAINAAGGYLPKADSRMLNHAMKLADEYVIYVPIEGEDLIEMPVVATNEISAQQSDGKININTADEKELMTIPGIGPSKAAAIIQYRTDNGLFQSPEALMDISGIGQKTFEKLESQITVN